MKVFGLLMAGTLMASGVLVGAPAAHADFPNCGEIQQPKVLSGTATKDGAQFVWESKGQGAQYQTWINRYYDNEWHRDDGWGEAGGALGQFVPWEENGKIADYVSLGVIQKCYGQAWSVQFTVTREAAAATPTTVQTSYVSLTPNKDWSEILVTWAAVPGATEYKVNFSAPKLGPTCPATVTGTQYLWQKNSSCPMPGDYGTYAVNVVPVGPDISGLAKTSNYVTHKKPKIRCVKRSNLKVKSFKREKCPKGWVKR